MGWYILVEGPTLRIIYQTIHRVGLEFVTFCSEGANISCFVRSLGVIGDEVVRDGQAIVTRQAYSPRSFQGFILDPEMKFGGGVASPFRGGTPTKTFASKEKLWKRVPSILQTDRTLNCPFHVAARLAAGQLTA